MTTRCEIELYRELMEDEEMIINDIINTSFEGIDYILSVHNDFKDSITNEDTDILFPQPIR